MRAAIVADASFARREHHLLARLEIGLADEGVQIIHAVPDEVDVDDPSALYSTRLRYEPRSLTVSPAGRARRFIRAMAEATGGSGRTELDVVHAFGIGAWPLSLEVARRTRARPVLEIWSNRAAIEAERIIRNRAGGAAGQPAPTLLTPGQAIASMLRARCPGADVHVAPWGMPISDSVHPETRGDGASERALAVSVLATGRENGWRRERSESGGGAAIIAALDGLAAVCREHPDVLVFLDAGRGLAGRARAAVWRRARKLALLDRMTMVTDMEARREPLLQTDVLVQPEATGEHRSITLAAMAAGMIVVARADPLVDLLVDGKTAVLVNDAGTENWARAIAAALRCATQGRGVSELARTARDHVQRQHLVSRHVRAVVGAYEARLPEAATR